MRFLVDRCVGRRLSRHLNNQGHDVLDGRDIGADPGDRNLLELAASENRILITLDKGFGELIYVLHVPHAGPIRLPDVRMADRIALVEDAINLYGQDLEQRAIVTIQGGRTRVSRPDTI